jgi:restriction system protein
MSPRRKNSLLDDLHEIFLHLPSWSCIPAAIAAFVIIDILFGAIAAKNPMLKGLAADGPPLGAMSAILILAAGGTAAVKKFRRRQLYDRQTGINSIRSLSWRVFEALVGEAFRRQGFQVSETGGGGADGGIDLMLQKDGETTLVQCKHWRSFKVGVREVRELFGVMVAERAHRAVFVASGSYSREAREFAGGKPITLIDGTALLDLVTPARARQHVEVATGLQARRPATPACPVCRTLMEVKTAKRGGNAGSQFWGCPNFPACRGTRPIE